MVKDGEGWKFTENDGGRELYFTSTGLLDQTEDRNNNVTDYTYNANRRDDEGCHSDRGATGARTGSSYVDRARSAGCSRRWTPPTRGRSSIRTTAAATSRRSCPPLDTR